MIFPKDFMDDTSNRRWARIPCTVSLGFAGALFPVFLPPVSFCADVPFPDNSVELRFLGAGFLRRFFKVSFDTAVLISAVVIEPRSTIRRKHTARIRSSSTISGISIKIITEPVPTITAKRTSLRVFSFMLRTGPV